MLALNPTQTKAAVSKCLTANLPVMLWGSPGIGKSDLMLQTSDAMGGLLVDIRLSQYDSVDMRGIPSVDSGFTTWNPPNTLPFVGSAFDTPENKDRLILLFLDEILQALPAVQSTAFQLVLDRRVGEHILMPNTRVVAASNRQQDRAGANRMLTPLANRFVHLEMVPSLPSWQDWAWEHGIQPEVIGFLGFRPDLLSGFDPASASPVFPSPRTWEYVDRALKQDNDMTNLSPEVIAMVHGAVGQGPASELLSFIDTWRSMPDPDEAIADPLGTRLPDPKKPAAMFAMTAALAYRANKTSFKNIMAYARRLPPDYTVMCAKASFKKDPRIGATAEWVAVCSDYQDLIRA